MNWVTISIPYPSLETLFGWFVFYVCIGSILYAYYTFKGCWRSYGRNIRNAGFYSSLLSITFIFTYPLVIPYVIKGQSRNRDVATDYQP